MSEPLLPLPGAPTRPIEIAGGAPGAAVHLATSAVALDPAFIDQLRAACADVRTDPGERVEASRDWWPLAMVWATDGQVAQVAAAVVRPVTTDEVSRVLAACNGAGVPVTPAAGRSSVVGGTVPVFGGVVLDLTGLSGIHDVDATSLIVGAWAGTFGDTFEAELQERHGLTVGHWPQSMALSTVGGWVACRGAGQYSNRYGKIEDIVVGLEVVLADGGVVRTGGQPRQATGPDLTQLFVGSEGTLGIVTRVWMQASRVPTHQRRAAYGYDSFAEALDTMRRIVQRDATPAVLRLYDAAEAKGNFKTDDDLHVLLVFDEGEPALVDAGIEIVAEECLTARRLDAALVDHWLGHRNDVSALEALINKGYVVDTMEVSGPWAALPTIYESATAAIAGVPGTLAASAHQSHSYRTGGCLYFTFAAKVDPDQREPYYTAVWDAGSRAVLAAGGSLSHHHGVGLSRARFMAEAHGAAFDVMVALKTALDPNGVLNPGKLGFPSPFGEVAWP